MVPKNAFNSLSFLGKLRNREQFNYICAYLMYEKCAKEKVRKNIEQEFEFYGSCRVTVKVSE